MILPRRTGFFSLEGKKGKGRRESRAAPLREWIKKYP